MGGTELYAAALADAQARAGVTVTSLAGPAGELDVAARCAGDRPDVVHVHHLHGLPLSTPTIAKRAGARVVMTLHDYWLACARGQLVDGEGARCPGPSLDRCARCLSPTLLGRRVPLRRRWVAERRTGVAALEAAVDLFLSPSRHLPARLGIPAEYEPLPLLAPLSPSPPASPGPARLLFAGSLLPTKGPHLAVEAFARLPAGAATLRLVGPAEGEYAARLVRRAAEVPGVTVSPPVPHARMGEVYAGADVLVFPSTWDENSPLVLREAAAAGLRVVASDVPGVTECAPDAVRFETGSVDALRGALAAEVRRGRARVPPRAAGSMEAHAAAVLARYRKLLG
ncbi:MAG: glycosyltransferase [Myxococcota bacterium]